MNLVLDDAKQGLPREVDACLLVSSGNCGLAAYMRSQSIVLKEWARKRKEGLALYRVSHLLLKQKMNMKLQERILFINYSFFLNREYIYVYWSSNFAKSSFIGNNGAVILVTKI